MADLVWSDPDPEKEDFAISPRCVRARPCTRTALRSPNTDTSVVYYQQGCGIHFRFGRRVQVPGDQPNVAHSPRASTMYGGLYVPLRRAPFYCLVCAKLLLPLRKLGEHPRGGPGWSDVLQRLPSRARKRTGRPEPSGRAECGREGVSQSLSPIARAPAHRLPLVLRTSSCVRSCRSTSCNIRDGRTIPLAAQTAVTLDHNCILGSRGPARPA